MNEAASREIAARAPKVLDFRQVVRAECYYDHLDVAALEAILDKADAEAAGDADIRARLALLRAALGYAKCGKAVREAAKGKNSSDAGREAFEAARRAYSAFVIKAVEEQPLAYTPTGICVFDPWMYDFGSRKNRKKKK